MPLWLCSIIITWRHKISVTSGYIIISLQKSITGGTSIEGGCINYRGTQHLHGDMSITGSMSITCLFFSSNFGLSKVNIMLHEDSVAMSETCFAYNMVVHKGRLSELFV